MHHSHGAHLTLCMPQSRLCPNACRLSKDGDWSPPRALLLLGAAQQQASSGPAQRHPGAAVPGGFPLGEEQTPCGQPAARHRPLGATLTPVVRWFKALHMA